MSTLSTISTSTTGVAGILMAVPQLLGGNNPANTVGYQPQNQVGQPFNPPPLIFHYEGEQTVILSSDITDHWAEDNSTRQDQIALRPIRITTHGFIGELTTAPANSVLAALQVAANTLTLVSGFVPVLTVTAETAYNEAVFAYQSAQNIVNAGISAFSSIANGATGEAVVNQNGISNTTTPNSFGLSTQNKQQIYFQQFYGYYNNRTLFTVQTPWAVFQNMAIESLRAIQDAETNTITDFEVTFKMMRFASIGSVSTGASTISAASGTRNDYQSQPQVNYAGGNLTTVVQQPAFA